MPLLQEIDTGLRHAVPKAKAFFETYQKKPINRPLLSNLIRYFTLEYLRAHGKEASEEENESDGSWGFEGLSNNGIEIHYRNSRIRLRKGVEAPMPNTHSSLQFYQQVFPEMEDTQIYANLIVLWNLNAKLEYDSDMQLIRTKGLSRNKKEVTYIFRHKVVLTGVDLTRVVESEYSLPSELPMTDTTAKTGTTDAD